MIREENLNHINAFLFFDFVRKKEANFSEEMIEKLADRGEIRNDSAALPPPPISFSDVYLLTNNGEVVLLNENELFFFYKRDYSNKIRSFKDFLNAVLNDGLIVEKIYLNTQIIQNDLN